MYVNLLNQLRRKKSPAFKLKEAPFPGLYFLYFIHLFSLKIKENTPLCLISSLALWPPPPTLGDVVVMTTAESSSTVSSHPHI